MKDEQRLLLEKARRSLVGASFCQVIVSFHIIGKVFEGGVKVVGNFDFALHTAKEVFAVGFAPMIFSHC